MTTSLQFRNLALALLTPLVAIGCSQTAVRAPSVASAPALSEDSPAHIRGVSDPNAQFTLIDRTKSASPSPVSDVSKSAGPCPLSSLQVYEVAASMNGDNRVLRLAIKNLSNTACTVSGRPAIELQDDEGRIIASVAVRQTGSASLTGTVTASLVASETSSGMAMVLAPSSAATFEIGWSGGDECPVVSRFTISMPGQQTGGDDEAVPAARFTIAHSLSVCGGEVRVTALSNSGSA